MGKLYYTFLLALVCQVGAVEYRVQNLSGTNVVLSAGSSVYLLQPGSMVIPRFGLESVLFSFPSGYTNGWDFTASEEEVFSFLLGVDTVQLVEMGKGSVWWAWYGFGFGTLVFGFAWILRIVRGITSQGEEL